MDLEITNWNNNIINELSPDIFINKSNLNESVIDDSNYVSEDSVTLTEGSVEKDEDSLDYQNEYGNIDSITNSISDEFRDLNEKCMNKDLHSNNVEVDESSFKPLDYKEELIHENVLSENLAKEIVLHNIIVESDNGEIISLTNTTEIESDKMNNGNDNLDDANFYDCEDSESNENISSNYGNVRNNLNKSYDIVSGKLSDIEMIEADSLELSSNSSKKSSMTNTCKINKCFSNTNSDESELKSCEIFDASADESCLDYNNQDFVSSNWLMSVNADFNDEDDGNFVIENVFSFKKMKLSHFKIKDPLLLSLEISRKYSQNNNSYLNVYSSFQNNDTPIDFTIIHSSSTPYSTKHRNHSRNETFNKSGTFECKSLIMQTENVKSESVGTASQNFTNKTFNLEETKEMKSIDIDLSDKSNLLSPCSQTNSDIHDKTVDLASVKLNKLAPSKLQKPIENGIVTEKSNRLNKKIGSLLSIPSKSNPKPSDKPLDETKNKSLLKLPMDPPKAPSSIKPPSNKSVVKKSFSKTLPRDTVAPISSLNDVKTRIMPPFDPNRRHTITEEVFSSTQAVPKPSSRPTSLIKPNESKQQSIGGNCRIAKPIRPSSVMTSDKAQKSLPTQSSSQKESGIPKTVKSIKLQQSGGIQKTTLKNQKLSEIIISNQQDDNINSKQPIDEFSQLVTAAIVTPIISENPPIISPSTANSIINNPLNRTFDRDDFQTLKSSNSSSNNNDNCSSESSSLSSDVTIRSSTDSENNNKSQISRSSEQLGIYQLAQKEEENLKKHVNNSALISRQTVGFRSLKLPSQIKPRMTVPSSLLKK